MMFFDCEDGSVINLEHITEIEIDTQTIWFSNGRWLKVNPDLFKAIMSKIKEFAA